MVALQLYDSGIFIKYKKNTHTTFCWRFCVDQLCWVSSIQSYKCTLGTYSACCYTSHWDQPMHSKISTVQKYWDAAVFLSALPFPHTEVLRFVCPRSALNPAYDLCGTRTHHTLGTDLKQSRQQLPFLPSKHIGHNHFKDKELLTMSHLSLFKETRQSHYEGNTTLTALGFPIFICSRGKSFLILKAFCQWTQRL